MTSRALINVVSDILKIIAKDGLYKKQHLYITLSTKHPGVDISDFLLEEFEDEITIILQYEFWDLVVDDYGFSVSLAFEHDDETIYVPFSSIISILDPSEDFCLELTPNFADTRKNEKHNTKDEDKGEKSNVILLDMFRKGS